MQYDIKPLKDNKPFVPSSLTLTFETLPELEHFTSEVLPVLLKGLLNHQLYADLSMIAQGSPVNSDGEI